MEVSLKWGGGWAFYTVEVALLLGIKHDAMRS